jgi:AhpD family alkylhydroperoxidase
MELDGRTKALIAVGASVAANCQPCLQSTAAMALECGANKQEILEAIEVGKKVRNGACSRMDDFILDLNGADRTPGTTSNDGCGCNSSILTKEEGKDD